MLNEIQPIQLNFIGHIAIHNTTKLPLYPSKKVQTIRDDEDRSNTDTGGIS